MTLDDIKLSKFYITFFMLLIFIYICNELDFTGKSIVVILIFAINGVFSWMNIIKDDRFISLNKFFWYFQFVFMFLAPFCNYVSDYYPWKYYISNEEMIYGSVVVLLWNVIYFFVYYGNVFLARFVSKCSCFNFLLIGKEYSTGYRMLVFLISLISFLLVVHIVGLQELFFLDARNKELSGGTLYNLVIKTVSSFVTVCCCVFVRSYLKDEKSFVNILCMLITMVFCFCVFSPTGSPRQWFVGNFGGILLMLILRKKKSRFFDYLILAGLLVLFPFLHTFKDSTSDNMYEKITSVVENYSIVSSLNNIDFDAFTLIPRTMDYVSRYGIEWGYQVFGTLFFFIPRSIWIDKPLVSSHLVVGAQNADFINLSFPLAAEAYLDYGVLGVVLFAIIYGIFNKYVDSMYWIRSKEDANNVINIIYPFLCIDTLILNRGPLLPEYILIVVLIVPVIVINSFADKKIDTSKI